MFARFLSVALTVLATVGIVQAADKQKLQDAIKLPTVSFTFGVGVKDGRFVIGGAAAEARQETLRKKLQKVNPDAEDVVELADVLEELKDKKQAEKLLENADGLLRQRLTAEPNNSDVWAQIGIICLARDQRKEGEQWLRKAAGSTPPSSRALIALGWFFLNEGMNKVVPRKDDSGATDMSSRLKQMIKHPPDQAAIKAATALLEEGRASFDKAVAAAPNACRPYRERFSSLFSFALAEMQFGLGPKDRAENPMLKMFSPNAREDLYKAFLADPTDVPTATFLIVAEWYALLLAGQEKAGNSELPTWEDLPEPNRQRVQRALKQLEKAVDGPDKVASGGCAEFLGMLNYLLMKKPAEGATALQKALQIDAGRESARSLLEMHYFDQDKAPEREALCVERVKLKDSASARYLLAKAYFDHKKFDLAEEQMRQALKHDPQDYHANLGLAAVLLKRPEGKIPFAEVGRILDQVKALPAKDEVEHRREEEVFMRAIWHGLRGEELEGRGIISRNQMSPGGDRERGNKIIEALSYDFK